MTSLLAKQKNKLGRLLRRFAPASDGIAAVEFAMVLPIMLAMWIGTVEVQQAIAVSRKSILVSRTLADLTARATTINNAGMTNIFNATTAVLAPFPTTTLGMVVTSIKRNGANQNLVVWSDARGPGVASHPPNTPMTLPLGILTSANQSVILAESKYLYTPAVAWFMSSSGFTIDESTYMVPRLVPEIARVP